jgi:hypothetical protein
MIYKYDRLKGEWINLNDRVRAIIIECDSIASRYKLEVRITCIDRSDLEQKDLYAKLNKPYIPSLHSYHHAGDFTLFGEVSEADRLDCKNEILALNKKYTYGVKGVKKSIIFHDIGAGAHYHVQQPLE